MYEDIRVEVMIKRDRR